MRPQPAQRLMQHATPDDEEVSIEAFRLCPNPVGYITGGDVDSGLDACLLAEIFHFLFQTLAHGEFHFDTQFGFEEGSGSGNRVDKMQFGPDLLRQSTGPPHHVEGTRRVIHRTKNRQGARLVVLCSGLDVSVRPHRACNVMENLGRYRAQQQTAEGAVPVGGHHYQIDLMEANELDNCIGGVSDDRNAFDRDALKLIGGELIEARLDGETEFFRLCEDTTGAFHACDDYRADHGEHGDLCPKIACLGGDKRNRRVAAFRKVDGEEYVADGEHC